MTDHKHDWRAGPMLSHDRRDILCLGCGRLVTVSAEDSKGMTPYNDETDFSEELVAKSHFGSGSDVGGIEPIPQ